MFGHHRERETEREIERLCDFASKLIKKSVVWFVEGLVIW